MPGGGVKDVDSDQDSPDQDAQAGAPHSQGGAQPSDHELRMSLAACAHPFVDVLDGDGNPTAQPAQPDPPAQPAFVARPPEPQPEFVFQAGPPTERLVRRSPAKSAARTWRETRRPPAQPGSPAPPGAEAPKKSWQEASEDTLQQRLRDAHSQLRDANCQLRAAQITTAKSEARALHAEAELRAAQATIARSKARAEEACAEAARAEARAFASEFARALAAEAARVLAAEPREAYRPRHLFECLLAFAEAVEVPLNRFRLVPVERLAPAVFRLVPVSGPRA